MSTQTVHFCCLPPLVRKLGCCLLVATVLGQTSHLAAQEESPTRLLDLQPFDRITLKASHNREIIDTLLLELPGRKLPAPYPDAGKLELKRVSEPSVLYSVPWKAIEKIEFYEHLLLAKAGELTAQKNFIEAYEYLEFLHNHYSKLKGLQAGTERYLKRDALNAFSSKRFDESLTILLSLYDLNPNHSGLAGAVQAVTDRLISNHLASQDFGAARTALDSVEASFSKLQIKTIGTWRKKFQTKAEKHLAEAQSQVEQGNFHEARQAIRRTLAILPSLAGAKSLIDEINLRSPQVIVGVTQHGRAPTSAQLARVAAARVAKLTHPQLIELSDFGGEGGIYTCHWAEIEIDDSGLHFNIRLNEQARNAGIYPEMVALQLLQTTDPANPSYREDTAGLLQHASISDGRELQIQWRWPHVRPETLLQLSLQNLAANNALARVYQPVSDNSDKDVLLYDLPNTLPDASPNRARPPSIIERVYPSEEKALTDLVRGEVDVLERIAPWQVDRMRQTDAIVVGSYRLPTIHVLVPNYSKPLMRRREFRRALCYGIDRQRIVKEILLGGNHRAGFQVLSGPLPAGVSSSDPLGYAYKRSIKPRPYEPRLAAVLASVARTTLAKQAKPSPEAGDEQKPPTPEAVPLVLVHPPNALARTACQTIKFQLGAIGIPIQLTELSPTLDAQPVDYDLEYVEFPLWEPLVDLRRLLGPAGRAGSCSTAMSLALTTVDRSRNWKEARTRLQHVHEVAFSDLPVVPLWQTVNYFAHRTSLQGVGRSPAQLYQNVANWTVSFQGPGSFQGAGNR